MNKINYNYEKFFELTPDLLCIAGFDGYFKKVNAAVANTLGYSYEELYSSPINSFLHPLDVEMTNKVRASLTAFETLYNFENRYITKTGEIVWLSWTSRPSKEDRLIFASAKNISYRKRLELDKDNEFDNLVKINEAFKQLSYTTSHDLRSPLESLLAVFDLLDLNTIKDEKTIALINVLKRGGEKIKTRVDEYIICLSAYFPSNFCILEYEINRIYGKLSR
jgi:PAS domain S-box-containing protein